MPTPHSDPTYARGTYVFGFSVAGLCIFGDGFKYPTDNLLSPATFGGMFGNSDIEARMFSFLKGPIDIRTPRRFAIAPFHDIRLHGKWINRVVFSVRKGTQQIRRYTPYMGSPKPYLVPYMDKFAEAVALWQSFPDSTKTALNSRAAKEGRKYAGNNLWISLWLKDHPTRFDYLP